jgi:hypothetical protein
VSSPMALSLPISAADFCNDKDIATLDVIRFNVVEVGIARLVNPTEILAESVQNEPARGYLIVWCKSTDLDRHSNINDAIDPQSGAARLAHRSAKA